MSAVQTPPRDESAAPVVRELGVDSARDRRRRRSGVVFWALCLAATMVGVVALLVLLTDVLMDGLGVLRPEFFTSYASRFPERAGIKAPLFGTFWILGLTALIAFPVSVGAAIYLEEYAPKNLLTRIIQLNIANLAGVPSIVYGILGLAVFVRWMGLERSVISGALTLSILILPVIILASQEAIRAVPDSIRQAAYGLGATRWQVTRMQVLPMAMPGILTGTILALSRAVGETAPLIMIGALTFIAFTPEGLMDQFTVLPIQIYNWVSRPQDEFRQIAAAAIIVLLALLLTMNAAAIILRNRYSRMRAR
jgi:phosphate transport system permease protein